MSWRTFFASQAKWDESHIQPVVEFVRDGMTPEGAYEELRTLLADPDYLADWRTQNAEEIADVGAPSAEAAFQVWSDAFLRHSKDRMYSLTKNPGRLDARRRVHNPAPELSDEDTAAVEKYLEFHRYDSKHLDTVDIKIPDVVYKAGKGMWVTYRSSKVDPSTLIRPRRPVDYIHEFNAGVTIYRTEAGDGRERVTVPTEYRQVGALVKLGMCLGFMYKGPQGEVEGQTSRPMPELACSPDGKCLYVIQDRRRVLAMIWGGALGVFARGIDG